MTYKDIIDNVEYMDKLLSTPEQDLFWNVLQLRSDVNWTIAHKMAFMGYVFRDLKILKLRGHGGFTVAHLMAAMGYRFSDPEILMLRDDSNFSVAYYVANYV